EFQRYWRGTHGPLVARDASGLRIRRYVQTHTLDDPANAMLAPSPGAPPGVDRIAELWGGSAGGPAPPPGTPPGRAGAQALLEDERRFIAHARSPLWLAEEHPIVEG